MIETWKNIPKWENLYQASNLGRVRSLRKLISGETQIYILNPSMSSSGYNRCMLRDFERKRYAFVHQLVAEAFIDKDYRKKGLTTNHINSIRTDNRLCNLEVVTHSQNIIHSFTKGNREIIMGEKHYAAKISSHDVKQIKKMYNTGWYMQVTLSEMFGISKTNIHGILNNKIWKNKKHKIK